MNLKMPEIHRWFRRRVLSMILPVYFSFPVALRRSHLGGSQTPVFNISVCLNNGVFIWLEGG